MALVIRTAIPWKSLKFCSLPPQSLSSALGFVNLNMAIIFRASRGLTPGAVSIGVPSIGIRKLSGIESTSNSLYVSARSTLSSSDSPMPKIPPQQVESPTDLILFMVSYLSLHVCVLTILGKKFSDASRLWFTLLTPADFNFLRDSSSRVPAETQTFMGSPSFLISSTPSHILSTSSLVADLPLRTTQYLFAPNSTPLYAPSKISSLGTRLYMFMGVL